MRGEPLCSRRPGQIMSSQIFGRSRLLTRSLLPLIGRHSANRMADAGGSNVILRFIPIPSRALLYIVPNDRSYTWTDRSQVLLQHPPLRTRESPDPRSSFLRPRASRPFLALFDPEVSSRCTRRNQISTRPIQSQPHEKKSPLLPEQGEPGDTPRTGDLAFHAAPAFWPR
jgi:hypothetical protein